MKKTSLSNSWLLAAMALAGLSFSSAACGDYVVTSLKILARQAVSSDPTVSSSAISKLRAYGPAGLDALFEPNQDRIAGALSPTPGPRQGGTDEQWIRLRTALEAVAQQRDCAASHLYWFTDLDQAKTAAQKLGKPILSLRLLGKLNEEYSCANSRFFRTTLYANSEVSSYLRDHFILHWQSVRPVPRITVDFGDGRKIERTITGNSIHYILDAQGHIVDALPGLYGPRAFLRGLKKAEFVAHQCEGLNEMARGSLLREYHSTSHTSIASALRSDLDDISLGRIDRSRSILPREKPSFGLVKPSLFLVGNPTAERAGKVAVSKNLVERPLWQPHRPVAQPLEPERIQNDLTDEVWGKIAALHTEDATLDQSSRALIRSKGTPAQNAPMLATGKLPAQDPSLRSLRNLERSISEDTIRNEYLLHFRIHEWLAQEPAPILDGFNSRVYAELFLTPDSDPWLGLVPADTCSALDGDGLVTSATK